MRVFADNGLAGTSTEDIARLAGVSQPYVFRLFGSKQQLFLAAVGRGFERVRLAFVEAARHPIEVGGGYDPVLAAIGQAYGGRVVRAPQIMHGKTSRRPSGRSSPRGCS